MFSQARKSKAKINKQNYIKPRSFCTVKKTISKMKRLPLETEKIFANNISDKELLSKKELTQLNIQVKDGQWTQIDIFPKKTCRLLTGT